MTSINEQAFLWNEAMSNENNDLIEVRIITAVRKLLTGRVNEIIANRQFLIPIIEFGSYTDNKTVSPVITLTGCEKSEKERIIQLDVFFLTILFEFQEEIDSELYCYSFGTAVEKALKENKTLGGVADRVEITNKKYLPPKVSKCGEGWSVTISLKITVEGMKL